jgi:Prealbumin-like fold domain
MRHKRAATSICLVAVSVLLLPGRVSACSLIPHTYQVTQLKGRVVGRALGPLNFKWLQRWFSVPGAELVVYHNDSYPFDANAKPVAQIKADSQGKFEFDGLKDGIYVLHVKHEKLDDWFSVEVDRKAPTTSWITIDISPLQPDCSGGHVFDVEAARR